MLFDGHFEDKLLVIELIDLLLNFEELVLNTCFNSCADGAVVKLQFFFSPLEEINHALKQVDALLDAVNLDLQNVVLWLLVTQEP